MKPRDNYVNYYSTFVLLELANYIECRMFGIVIDCIKTFGYYASMSGRGQTSTQVIKMIHI